MAPLSNSLATVRVTITADMSQFAPQFIAGLAGARVGQAGAAAGAQFGTAFGKAAGSLMVLGFGAGLGLLLKDSVQAAGDFQAAMIRLVTSAGETGTRVSGNLKTVADGILAMAGPVGTTTENLAKAMYTVESGSFHGADALLVLRAAAEGAKAEQSDLTKVTNAVTTALVDYHLPADQAALVTSKMIAATAAGKVSFEQLTGALHSVLPIAAAAGVSINDILGSLAAMTLHGMSAEQATQNLADVIRHMQAPTNEQTKELALLGLTAQQLGDNLRSKGLSGTLQDIANRIKGMYDPESQRVILDLTSALTGLDPKVRALGMRLIEGTISYAEYRKEARDLPPILTSQAVAFASLAGTTHRIGNEQVSGRDVMQNYGQALAKATGDAAGLNVALQLTGDNAGLTNHAIGMVAAAATEAGNHVAGWSVIQETFNFKLAALHATLGTVAIALGTTLLPIMGRIVDAITAILGPMSEWITAHETLTAAIAGTVSSLIAIGTSVVIITKLVQALAALSRMLGITAVAQWALNAAVGTNVVITSLAEAQIAAYLLWSRLVTAATWLWTTAQSALDAAFIASPIGWIVLAIAALVAGVVYAYFHFDAFRRFVDKLWQSLQQFGHTIWDALVVAFHAVGDASVWLWEHALKPAFAGIMVAVRAVGDAGVWLWEHALKPAFAGIMVAVHWVGDAALWLWHEAIIPAFNAIVFVVKAWWEFAKASFGFWVAAAKVVGEVAVWLWQHVMVPAFNAIVIVVKIWWEYAKIVFAAFKIAAEVVGTVVMWLYHNVFHPAFTAIGFLIHAWWVIVQIVFAAYKLAAEIVAASVMWLWHTVFEKAFQAIADRIVWWWNLAKSVFQAVVNFFKDTLGPIFLWFWHSIIETAWNGIKNVITVWWATIKSLFQTVVNFLRETFGPAFTWLWHSIFEPVWNGIKNVITIWWTGMKVLFQAVMDFVRGPLATAFTWFWHSLIEPIWTGIKTTISNAWLAIRATFEQVKQFITVTLPSAFQAGVDKIGQIWSRIKTIVAVPVNAVIDVINSGIIDSINTVANWLHVKDRIPHIGHVNATPISPAQGTGGGGGAGHVAVAAGGLINGPGGPTDDMVPALLSAGEYVIPARVVRNLGSQFFDQMIGTAPPEASRTNFAHGGVAHFAAGGLVGLLTDPAGWLGDRVNGLIARIPDGGIMRDVAVAGAHRLVDNVIGWIKEKIAAMFPAGGGGAEGIGGNASPGFPPWPSSPGAQRGDSGVWRNVVALIRSTGPISGSFGNSYRPGDPLWHGSGRAVDWMGYEQDALATFLSTRRPLELIHRTSHRDYAYTRGVNKGSFNQSLMQAHRNHVHIAMDEGGWLEPGWNPPTWNGTGRPERVRTADQDDRLVALLEEQNMLLGKLGAAIDRVAPAVGDEMRGVSRGMVAAARIR